MGREVATVEVRPGVLVPLGYGKYFRSDKIVGLEPIEDDRGPGRRTYVYVEGLAERVVASRSDESIVRAMTAMPQEVADARAALDLLRDLRQDIGEVSPVLRRILKEEGGLDLGSLAERIDVIMGPGDGGGAGPGQVRFDL